VNIANTWAYIGVRDPGRFRWEQSGGPVPGTLFAEGDKEGQEWAVISTWGL
jgi:hypothetical protein